MLEGGENPAFVWTSSLRRKSSTRAVTLVRGGAVTTVTISLRVRYSALEMTHCQLCEYHRSQLAYSRGRDNHSDHQRPCEVDRHSRGRQRLDRYPNGESDSSHQIQQSSHLQHGQEARTGEPSWRGRVEVGPWLARSRPRGPATPGGTVGRQDWRRRRGPAAEHLWRAVHGAPFQRAEERLAGKPQTWPEEKKGDQRRAHESSYSSREIRIQVLATTL